MLHRRTTLRARRRGYLLLEVLVSGVVVATGILAMMAMLARSRVDGIVASRDVTASSLAQQKLEQLRSMDYASIPTGVGSTDTITSYGATYDRTWDVSEFNGTQIAGVMHKEIRVTVEYVVRNGIRSYQTPVLRLFDPN